MKLQTVGMPLYLQTSQARLLQRQLHSKQNLNNKTASFILQARFTVGAPNDHYEQEADRVADEVMRIPDAKILRRSELEEEEEQVQTKSIVNHITPLVQRQPEFEEEEEVAAPKREDESSLQEPKQSAPSLESVPTQDADELGEEETLQTKSLINTPTPVSASFQGRIQSLKGKGQALPGSERTFFEPRFGSDFSDVRVHTDHHAAQSAQSIHAHAFTIGRDVVFNNGQFAPQTDYGRRLLAHELTHVVQQRGQHGLLHRDVVHRDIVKREIVQRDVADELGTTPSLDLLARQLDDDQEEDAISTFGTLSGPETDSVLTHSRWRTLAMSAFNNAEMHRAMMATGQRGLLFSKLIWEFREGTNWTQLSALIGAAPRPQRRQVITETWFRDQFVNEVGNERMGIAVRLLGPPLRNQLDWMIEEGVDEDQFSRLIEESIPDEIYSASRDTALMTRLRGELSDSSPVVSALVAARQVTPTGTTPVGSRWSSDDSRMLVAQSARVGIISPRMAVRVPGAITALSATNYTAFRGLLTAAGSDTERAFICKALVSGHTITEITAFAGTIHGMSDAWLLQNLNVFRVSSAADTAAGTGIIQQFVNSCGPTSVQMIRADADPIYALSLNSAGPIGTAPSFAVSNPASITNAPLASEQSTMLTSHAAAGTGIAPINRVTPTPQGGAWVESDMNARRAATGVEYTRRDIDGGFSIDDALAVINVNVGMGIDVPIIVGSGPGSFAHYVVVVRKSGSRYQIHDVWNGQTLWRTARDFRLSQLNLPSTHVALSAIAEPRLVS